MTLWIAWSVLISTLVAIAAIATERISAAYRLARRGVWIMAIIASTLASGVVALRTSPEPGASNDLARGTIATSQRAIADFDRHVTGPSTGIDKTQNTSSLAKRADEWIVPIWATMSLACFVFLALSVARFARRRSTWTAMMTDVGPVAVSPDDGPAVIGFLNPQIVMPRWALDSDAATCSLMLRHEAEHLRAGDSRVLFGSAMLVALLPWNPALWLMARRLRLAIEVDCDARVIRSVGAAREYGLMLLSVSDRCTAPLPASALLFERGAQLEARINAMTTPSVKRPLITTAISAAIAGLVLATAAWTPRPLPFRATAPAAPSLVAPVVGPAAIPAATIPSTPRVTSPSPRRPRVVSRELEPSKMPFLSDPEPVGGNPAPRYPDEMRSAAEEGVVVVSFVTDERGVPDTTSIAVVQASNELLTASVRSVLPRWHYSGAGPVVFACRFNIASPDNPRDSTYVRPQYAPGVDTTRQIIVTGNPVRSRPSTGGTAE